MKLQQFVTIVGLGIIGILVVVGCGQGVSTGTTTTTTTSTTTTTLGIFSQEAIAGSGQGGYYVAIDLDSNGKTHISHKDVDSGDLIYTTNKNGTWETIAIDTTGNASNFTSLAIDSADKIHISYVDSDNNYLKYITNASGSWEISTLALNVLSFSSIGIDSNDKVHISYRGTNNTLMYITNKTGSWVPVTIDSATSLPADSPCHSLAVDSLGKVHIAYYSAAITALKYTTNSSGSWASETIASISGTLDWWTQVAVAVDSSNRPHVCYFMPQAGGYNSFMYANKNSGSWGQTTLDSTGEAGCSITIDSNDKVRASYMGNLTPVLKYATNVSGSWETYIADGLENVGYHNSIKIDGSDKAHIGYYDGRGFPANISNRLRYAIEQ